MPREPRYCDEKDMIAAVLRLLRGRSECSDCTVEACPAPADGLIVRYTRGGSRRSFGLSPMLGALYNEDALAVISSNFQYMEHFTDYPNQIFSM